MILKEGKYIKNVHSLILVVFIISGGGGTGQPSGTTQGNQAFLLVEMLVIMMLIKLTDLVDNIGTPQDPQIIGPGEAILWGLIADLVGSHRICCYSW